MACSPRHCRPNTLNGVVRCSGVGAARHTASVEPGVETDVASENSRNHVPWSCVAVVRVSGVGIPKDGCVWLLMIMHGVVGMVGGRVVFT